MAKLPDYLDSLSDDAKAVGGAWFSMMVPGSCSGLQFAMIEYQPSPRSNAAIAELLAAGLISRDEFKGVVNYKPTRSFRPLLAWMHDHEDDECMRFKLVEPIRRAALSDTKEAPHDRD